MCEALPPTLWAPRAPLALQGRRGPGASQLLFLLDAFVATCQKGGKPSWGFVGLARETKLGKTKAGRKEEFIQWKGTQEELVLLFEILKQNGLIHFEQFPETKICKLFVDAQFQSFKKDSVKIRNAVVRANREELEIKKMKLISKIK